MNKPAFELADIIRESGISFTTKHAPLKYHRRVLNALQHCRTAYLGGHIDRCTDCGHERISYNSCRNRHCPKCQATNRERWIMEREKDLLPVTYFHVVFTLPSELNEYCIKYPVELYNILLKASQQTVSTLGKDPKHLGAKTGMISVLHTWGQQLWLHPHVHCIVPGGGYAKDGRWKKSKSEGKYLFPVQVMSAVYRGKFMQYFKTFLEEIKNPITVELKKMLYEKKWVVYAKRPFLGPKQVIEYIGRYTHRIAISNHRIKSVKNGKVAFTYKDYADQCKTKLMTLDAEEFLRRFCLHILPPKFMKIRHYGFLSSRGKSTFKKTDTATDAGMKVKKVEKIKITWQEIAITMLNFNVGACPCCKTGKMITILQFAPNAPPLQINDRLKLKI